MEPLYALLGVFALLMLISLLSSKLSGIINMPCLLLFLAVGLAAGSDLLGKHQIEISDATVANYIGSVAMAFILFSGGFDTSIQSVKSVFFTGGILSSLGVLMTALFSGGFAWVLSTVFFPDKQLSYSSCFLLGAIISSTDAAAVFSILRSRSVSLKNRLQPLLEFESGSNDPMATLLTLFMLGIVLREKQTGMMVPWQEYFMIFPYFLWKMSIGLAAGYLLGRAAVWLYNKINFEYNGLYYALGIVMVLLTYATAESITGNGFMAVYTAGMVMGNRRFVFHNGLGRFYDGLAWIMQVILFTMLGVLAVPSLVWTVKWFGFAVALFLMFVARPLAVGICMWRSSFTLRERLLTAWVGLRGGAPIMLATFPLMNAAVFPEADLLFNVIFFIVLTSVLVQGMTIMPLAKLLDLAGPLRKKLRVPLTFEETGDANSDFRELPIPKSRIGQSLKDLHLPMGVLVLLIRRDDRFVVPRGDTILEADDVLTLMGTPEAIRQSKDQLSAHPM
ncbi:MAG: potassium/proton antiporter [Lentisphaeria bacterium]|nr:potassium/proton antiporter [Lentisphaeria bacterium]